MGPDAGPRLLALFLEELDDQLRVLNEELLALEEEPDDAEHLRAVFRVAHTLKGAARAANVPALEQSCHALEDLLAAARDGRRKLGPGDFALLFQAADALAAAGRRIRAGEPADSPELQALRDRLRHAPSESPPASSAPPPPPPVEEGQTPVETEPEPEPAQAAPVGATLRVEPEKLDAVLATAGEVLTASRRAASYAAQVGELEEDFARLLARGTPQGPFAAGVRELVDRFRSFVSSSREDTRTLLRTGNELVDRVQRLRMRPFSEAVQALPRVVRDVAAAEGKEVRLVVDGEEVELDRAVLEVVREALIPAVRNAVDHGIEPPEERERAGKDREGTVRVDARLRGDRVVVRVSDDGRGLGLAAIRARLEARGLPVPEDDGEVVRQMIRSGISTRAEATEISGRGIGLDIVRDSLERVRGSGELTSEPGRGTTLTLECPLSLAVVRAVLVGIGPHLFAVPTLAVERLLRVRADAVRSAGGRSVVPGEGAPVPLLSLARLLGPPLADRPVERVVRGVVVAHGDRRIALSVDRLEAEEELVLRPLPPGARSGPFAGAALLGSGALALVLDTHALLAAALEGRSAASPEVAGPESAPARRILVADDSLTTRSLEQSVLEAAGYRVSTAVDGLDALRQLQAEPFDLVVSDVEMPRMDGFALCEAIRSSPRLRETPVVLVTALESEQDRARGLEAGADAYLPKSSFDQQTLLDTIHHLLD